MVSYEAKAKGRLLTVAVPVIVWEKSFFFSFGFVCFVCLVCFVLSLFLQSQPDCIQ